MADKPWKKLLLPFCSESTGERIQDSLQQEQDSLQTRRRKLFVVATKKEALERANYDSSFQEHSSAGGEHETSTCTLLGNLTVKVQVCVRPSDVSQGKFVQILA